MAQKAALESLIKLIGKGYLWSLNLGEIIPTSRCDRLLQVLEEPYPAVKVGYAFFEGKSDFVKYLKIAINKIRQDAKNKRAKYGDPPWYYRTCNGSQNAVISSALKNFFPPWKTATHNKRHSCNSHNVAWLKGKDMPEKLPTSWGVAES